MKLEKLSKTNLQARAQQCAGFGFVALLLTVAATFVSGFPQDKSSKTAETPSKEITITAIPFGETNGNDVYNASGVVSLGDSRFLFCDNNSNDALFELNLTPDSQKKGTLIRRPLQGLAADAADDLEAITLAREKGSQFIIATSSLSVKKAKDGQPPKIAPSGLLRIKVNSDNSLSAENLPGFRDWFIQHAPVIAASATRIPDENGLNIEGLAWDPERHALLFGVRSPLSANKPILIPVRVKNLAGSWTTDNLEMLPPILLTLGAATEAQGIRDIQYAPSRNAFLIIVGKTVSGSKAPFELYEWKGGKPGKMRRLNVSFADKMKPEGISGGTVAGKPVFLIVDDAGGFQVLQAGILRP